jgi:hypothetical protein
MHPRRGRLDLLGAAVSCACACHCVVLPLALALVPAAAGLGALLDEGVESGLLAVTVLVGTVSFGPAVWGAARDRTWWRAPALFAVGALLLFLSRVLEARESDYAEAAVLGGAALVATAHLVKRRLALAAERSEASAACCPCPDGRAAR